MFDSVIVEVANSGRQLVWMLNKLLFFARC